MVIALILRRTALIETLILRRTALVVSLVLWRTTLVKTLILWRVLTLRSRATEVELWLRVALILLLRLLGLWSSRRIVRKNTCKRDADFILLLGWCRGSRTTQEVKDIISSCLTSGRLLLLARIGTKEVKLIRRTSARLTLTVMLVTRMEARHRIRNTRRRIILSSFPVGISWQRIKTSKGVVVSFVLFLCF